MLAGRRKRGDGTARRRHLAALPLAATLVLTAACGARWSDEERAAVLARHTASGSSSSATPGEGGGTTTTVAGTPGDDAGTGGDAIGGGSTGGIPGGSTGGTGGGVVVAGGPRPCAAPSTERGVTNDSITLGHISTVSGPVPGLGESAVAATRSYVAYKNATGGVCGRKLVLKTGDDGSENGRFRALVTDMASSSLALVGNFAAGDGGGVDVATAQKLPAVVTAFSDAFEAAPTVFDVNPPPPDPRAQIGKFKYLYAQGVRTAAISTLAQAQSLSQLNLQQSLMEAVGIRVVLRQELPLSTLSYDAPARAVANSKADYFLFLGAGNLNSSYARSLKDTGYQLKFNEFLTAYGSSFISVAGAAAEGVTSWARALPVEEAGSNAEVATFASWMRRTAPGTPIDTIAADAWAASKAFVDALQALPGPITRDAVLVQLRATDTFDGGGFFGPIKLGAKKSGNCYVAMKVVGGKWTRLTPERGFLC